MRVSSARASAPTDRPVIRGCVVEDRRGDALVLDPCVGVEDGLAHRLDHRSSQVEADHDGDEDRVGDDVDHRATDGDGEQGRGEVEDLADDAGREPDQQPDQQADADRPPNPAGGQPPRPPGGLYQAQRS